MQNSGYLLPHPFSTLGWIIFLPSLIFGLVIMIKGDVNGYFTMTGNHEETLSQVLNNASIIGIIIGAIFIGCSRERDEDEMIASLRLNALLIALYVSSAVLICATLFFYGKTFCDLLIYNMFTMPVLFVTIFRTKIWLLNRRSNNEM